MIPILKQIFIYFNVRLYIVPTKCCTYLINKGCGESAYNFEDFFVVLVGPLLRSRSPEALEVSE